ncbi:unnamed protein product [Leptosia nina]|uniref:Uncharacterized protein n=1 Tax=Leptosia nina TaxID=320188 RepID=A0AAV1K0H3_9NEOP
MWKTSFSNSSGDDLILRRLKKQLASLTCKCKICEKYNVTPIDDNASVPKTKAIQAHPSLLRADGKSVNPGKEKFCPGCYVAYNLLKKNDNRTFKDEESETNSVTFSSDKGVQQTVKSLDRTTSMSMKKSVKYMDSIIFDLFNQESDIIFKNNDSKKNIEQMNFINVSNENSKANCLCLENFIDSIRPPLRFDIFK